jgi:hypothetical protein
VDAFRVTDLPLAAHLVHAAVLRDLTLADPVSSDAARPDEPTTSTVSLLHWFPVASMPPSVPPEQSCAEATTEKSAAAIIAGSSAAFISVFSIAVKRRTLERARAQVVREPSRFGLVFRAEGRGAARGEPALPGCGSRENDWGREQSNDLL